MFISQKDRKKTLGGNLKVYCDTAPVDRALIQSAAGPVATDSVC